MNKDTSTLPGSFRDPSGFLFKRDGCIYRQVNLYYKEDYNSLMNSGLYQDLVDSELLIPHQESNVECPQPGIAYKIIKPRMVPFISYPYEWCFSQLKDAALTTLRIQKKALDYGMSLKDSSAYNIQFINGKPILIDTLSFEKYKEGEPWVAYRQFCQHFLGPLALMRYRDIRLNQLLRTNIDGIPLDMSSSLLPIRTRLKLTLLIHIHLHARSQKRFSENAGNGTNKGNVSRRAFLGLVDNLEAATRKLKLKALKQVGTAWADYYGDSNYTEASLRQKAELVDRFLGEVNPGVVWDLGANTGLFSRVATKRGIRVISMDVDPECVERNYIECVNDNDPNILPLLIDLTNPSPGIGWENRERTSLLERGPSDTVLALALIHHMAISNNLPIAMIAEFFSCICGSLIIEFVPKSDSQVQRLLSSREDIFPDYTRQHFEQDFKKYFQIKESEKVTSSERTLYLMIKNGG